MYRYQEEYKCTKWTKQWYLSNGKESMLLSGNIL